MIESVIKELGALEVPNPKYGDLCLNVFPLDREIPDEFNLFRSTFHAIRSLIPYAPHTSNLHYLTIDSKFFTKDEFLRREGIHIDGNFCADPNFSGSTWGGTTIREGWGGFKMSGWEVIQEWKSPYDLDIPIGEYISKDKGGILCVSNEIGCRAWEGNFNGEVGSQGDVSHLEEELSNGKEVLLGKNELYFMTSNTPHETLLMSKGTRRTFIRITLAHDYPNNLILN